MVSTKVVKRIVKFEIKFVTILLFFEPFNKVVTGEL